MARPRGPLQDLAECVAAIEALEDPDRAIAQWLHKTVLELAPQLAPRTFYAMPAYYFDGKNVLFFQSGIKFKTRYSTLGFSQAAALDDGDIWPTSYAITELTEAVKTKIRHLILAAVPNTSA